MEDVLERGRQRRLSGVRLVQATYHTRSLSLYTKLGFDTRELLVNLQGAPLNVAIPGRAVRPVTEGDVAACDALCERVHGLTRTRELLGLTSVEAQILPELDPGIALWKVGRRSFLVQHRLSALELELVEAEPAPVAVSRWPYW
ncbi:MAG: hypothetical protein KY463_16430 [Actinobacteria bacterium]|nr:hypothetical protein [Actinomycetota bacterium]